MTGGKRFFAESDGGFYYIIDREAPMCNERGYLGQRGRDRTNLDCLEVGDKFGWLGHSEIKKLAKELVKKWNANPPWPPCPLSDRGPSPKYGFPVIGCDHCQPASESRAAEEA